MKNTHQLLTDTINHLQKLADNLGDLNKFKDAAQPELTRDTGKPKIECSHYYTVGSDGTSVRFTNDESNFETDCENFYNVFETETETEVEFAYTLASRRVRAFAKAVNGDKLDWKNTKQLKWGVSFTANKGFYVDNSFVDNWFIHQIAFLDVELATKALELFRPEWEILANP
jgi:hypothetical protein